MLWKQEGLQADMFVSSNYRADCVENQAQNVKREVELQINWIFWELDT